MPPLLRRPTVWIALVLALAGGGFAAVKARGPSVEVVRVTRRNLEQHLVASGRVWVPARVSVAAQVPGLVTAVGAVEGQKVDAGALLVQIDDTEARSAEAQARAALDQAKARVEQLRKVGAIVANEGLRQAEANLARADAELGRVSTLVASGALPQSQLDDARRAVDVARAQRTAAAAQQVSAAPLGADSRGALGAQLQAEAQLAGATARLAHTRLVAREPGLVLDRAVEPGDTVQPGKTLLVLALAGAPQIAIQPDERNLAWIRLGQRAKVAADAFPQDVFEATVSYVAPAVDPQRGSVEVRLAAPAMPEGLKPDMTVSVDLTVDAHANVLTARAEAVIGASTPDPYVLVVAGGRLARRAVRLGLRGEGDVELVSGVNEGDELALPRAQVLREGQRVRPSPADEAP